MGLAASQARLLMLTGRKSDLELQGQNKAQERMQIANDVQKLLDQKQNQNSVDASNSGLKATSVLAAVGKVATGVVGSLVPGAGPVVSAITSVVEGLSSNSSQNSKSSDDLDSKLAKLQQKDKVLELKLKQIDTQHKAVQTETESVQKVIDKNIETSFKTIT